MYPREKKGKKKQSVMDFTSFLLSFQPLQAGNIFSPFYFIFFFMFCVVGMCLTWKKKFLESKREKRKKKLLNDRKVL